ncbi:Hypothetical protein PFR_JS21-2_1679 [Propionibacterium freudenreichii]|uniref:Uncharacterized protein n=3 Tax=Propionibacterium freudenreichii TaxID=1744 RepID=D7GCD0_PROFC|nr:Hypothetical protein RM25_0620 [Propionibacterium freudenreichii subsp. freudenreichii]CBL56191.1 Hypothetical protein PFREUD_06600 [Propionibacterium freudenreichii subsp. shermanii CIRM-BIA1]CEG85238.1 Hypothetical protein PFCIRM118_06960 [Propionibacterium freudenreichii]SPB31556.1 hypothetical protein MAJHIDBO_01810 [Propionibacterium freudenreichii subsp. shermanii]CDP47862.1 Hypothetical protein PFCIRM129_07775 [Propionibacterium freudenreichii subsp. freudenreichii]
MPASGEKPIALPGEAVDKLFDRYQNVYGQPQQ